MKNKYKRKSLYTAIFLTLSLMWSSHAMAALLNGDFSNGFDNWQGDLIFDGIVDPDNFPVNYDASTGDAVLTSDVFTFSFNSGGNFLVDIFQDFTVQSLLNPSNTLRLDFGTIFNFDDPADSFFAQILDLNDAAHFLDLSGSNSFDITSFAGDLVELRFGLENIGGPDFAEDSLTISNVIITQNQATTVPEPISIFLISTGLLLMKRKKT